MTAESVEITRLLVSWSDGDRSALDKLTPFLYTELRRLAADISAASEPVIPCSRPRSSMKLISG